MSFEVRGFRDLALYLRADRTFPHREALNRTVVGRLYYATYLRIRAYVREQGIRVSTLGTVLGALQTSELPDAASVDLEELHALRNRADYDDTSEFRDGHVELALRLVARIEPVMAPHW